MKKLIFFSLIAICCSSCKHLVVYTDALRTQHGWGTSQLEHIQFRLSKEIILERKLVSGFEDHIHGKVVTKKGVKTEVIRLRRHLPVAFVEIKPKGSYLIKCETGEGNTLTFGVNPNGTEGKFSLLASEWQDGYGKVHYNDVEFFVSTNDIACLLIDLRKRIHEHNTFTNLRGVKVK